MPPLETVPSADNLTIGIEHRGFGAAYAVVRYCGELCNIFVPAERPEKAIEQAREMSLDMIPKGQLRTVIPALV